MGDPLPVPAASNTFERIKRIDADGPEFLGRTILDADGSLRRPLDDQRRLGENVIKKQR